MKRLLKYLVLSVVAAAFWCGADKDFSQACIDDVTDISFVLESYGKEISSTDQEFNLPRQTSVANSQRVQSSVRRTGGTQRNNMVFAKSGRIENAGIRFFVQRKSITSHSSLIEPSHRLLSLGKLII